MIFYTSVTNNYDRLASPPELSEDVDVRFICFYDGDQPDADGWEYIKLEIDEECPVRKSYHPKHCPHLYFKSGVSTVWIDASYSISKYIATGWFSREPGDVTNRKLGELSGQLAPKDMLNG